MSIAVREQAWSMVVPHDAGGARKARQQLAAELSDLLPPALLADTVAVVAELLGNAVRHADPLPGGVMRLTCRVRLRPGAAGIELRVSDGGSELTPVERQAGPDAVDGRGLAIVAALARAWGVDREGDGQCVWASLGLAEKVGHADKAGRPGKLGVTEGVPHA